MHDPLASDPPDGLPEGSPQLYDELARRRKLREDAEHPPFDFPDAS